MSESLPGSFPVLALRRGAVRHLGGRGRVRGQRLSHRKGSVPRTAETGPVFGFPDVPPPSPGFAARRPRQGRRRPRSLSRTATGQCLLASVVLTLVVGACGGETGSTTSTPGDTSATTSPVTTSPVTTGPAANDLSGFPRLDVVVAGEPFTVATAATAELRSRGLMGVTDLVDVDGMLFVFVTETYTEPVQSSFWMKDTLIPLDIWFFDYSGKLVDMLTMTPCDSEPCQLYTPAGPYHYALETEVGRIDPNQTVELDF